MWKAWQPTPVFFPGESPWTEEAGGLQSMGSQKVGHDWATKPSKVGFILSYLLILLASILFFFFSLKNPFSVSYKAMVVVMNSSFWVSFNAEDYLCRAKYSFFFFSFIFISWRLITLQYCSGFCRTLTWISHGFTCIPHPDPPSHLPLYPIPLDLPSAAGPSTCLMHQPGLVICFTLDNTHVSMLFFWTIPPSPSPTESKSLFCSSVSLFLFCI